MAQIRQSELKGGQVVGWLERFTRPVAVRVHIRRFGSIDV